MLIFLEQEKERLLSGGIFQAEESRISSDAGQTKRKFDDMNAMTHGASSSFSSGGSTNNLWDDFQSMMMGRGGNQGSMENYLGRVQVVPGPGSMMEQQ